MSYIDNKQSIFLDATDVHVFPFGKERAYDSTARALSEKNLGTLVTSCVDRSCYVVKHDDSAERIDFVMGGYAFSSPTDSLPQPCFAHISIQENLLDGGDTYKEHQTMNAYITDGGNVTETSGAQRNIQLEEGCNEVGVRRFDLDVNDNDIPDGSNTQKEFTCTYTLTADPSEDSTITLSSLTNITIDSVKYAKSSDTTLFYDLHEETENAYLLVNSSGDSPQEGDYSLEKDDIIKITFDLESEKTDGSMIVDVLHGAIFTGVWFSQSADIEGVDETLSLQLFDKAGEVPEASYHKFNATSVDVHRIVCGNARSLARSQHDIFKYQQASYDALRQIQFKWKSDTYSAYAEENMTWREWLNSKYYVSFGSDRLQISNFPISGSLSGSNTNAVYLDNIIKDNWTYTELTQ